jgi:hypothetical protein
VRDAAEIRLAAIGEGILCLTSVDTALAAARSLEPSVRERIDEIGTLEEWLSAERVPSLAPVASVAAPTARGAGTVLA